MIVANMLYDPTFKKVMQNDEVANFFLSSVLKTQVRVQNFESLENPMQYVENNHVIASVTRLDFAATIIDENGKEKKVLIEMQKSGDYRDAYRFRHYLACQMIREDANKKVQINQNNLSESFKDLSLKLDLSKDVKFKEIISIYMLNYNIGINNSVVCTTNNLYAPFQNKEIEQTVEDSAFLRILHNRLYVIQIPKLEEEIPQVTYEELDPHTKNLYDFLELYRKFGSESMVQNVNINEEDYAPVLKPLLHELNLLTKNQELQQQMQQQDLYNKINEARRSDDIISGFQEGIAASQQEIDKALEREKKAEEDKLKAEEEAKRTKEKMIKSIKKRLERGDSISDIAEDMDLSESEIIALKNL